MSCYTACTSNLSQMRLVTEYLDLIAFGSTTSNCLSEVGMLALLNCKSARGWDSGPLTFVTKYCTKYSL